ncbi:MAG: Ig domain-containing protein [Muribaculaceae bacterium]
MVSNSAATITPTVTVGGQELTSNKSTNLGTSKETRSFAPASDSKVSGELVINFSGSTGGKNLLIYSISVTYDPDATVGGDKPADPVFKFEDTEISDPYTFTSTTGGTIVASYDTSATSHDCTIDPEDAATFTDNNAGNYTITVTKSCAITVSATNASGTTSKTLNVTVPAGTVEQPTKPYFFDSNSQEITGSTYAFDSSAGGNIVAMYDTADDNVSYTVTPSNAATVVQDSSNGTYTFTVTKSCTISVTATKGTATATATLDVTVPGAITSNTFVLVTESSELELGAKYVIVTDPSKSTISSMSPVLVSGAAIPQISDAVTKPTASDNNTIEVDINKVAVFTLLKGNDNFYVFQYADGENFLSNTDKNAGLSHTKTQTDASAQVSINPSSTNTVITFENVAQRVLKAYLTQDFRTYNTGSGSKVFLFKQSTPKTSVTLAWDQAEYTANTAFGWESSEPVLTITPAELNLTAKDLGVTYSSSATSVATVAADADGNLVVTPVSTGNSTISAVVPNSNAEYKSNTATFTLHVTAAPKVIYANADGTDFEENQVVLLPSQIKAGYTFLIKAPEGYTLGDVNSDQVNNTTITFNDDRTVATIVVTKACVISAKVKKGEQQASRGTTFTVSEKALGDANINWSAEFYAYDLATGLWKNEPQLINNDNLAVTYGSSDQSIVTIDAKGKVTIVGNQGSAQITATVQGTDDYNTTTVFATVRVTDSTAPAGYDVFEMVTKLDQLKENEQFIVVSGDPYNGVYYACSPYQYKTYEYYSATAVELPENGDGTVLFVADDADVLRLSKQYDTNNTNASYPYLFQVMNHDAGISGRYIQVKKAKLFSLVDLPENIADRGTMNGNVQVLDPDVIEGYVEKDYANYGSALSEFLNKGEVIFNGTNESGQSIGQYFFRFNYVGKALHFNLYSTSDDAYKSDSHSKQSTYPVRLYRLAKRVEKPSITVYPEEPVPSDVAYQRGIVFNNKVRVVVEKNPKTSAEAKMMRTWQHIGHNPALPDYTAVDANKVTIFVDGHVVTSETGEFIRYIDPDFNDETATRTLFAVSRLDDVYSESAEARFQFRASAPTITKVSDGDNGSINVRVSRPASYTLGAKLFYVISDNDAKPSVTFNLDGSVAASTGTEVIAWTGDAADTTTGIVNIPEGQSLWVGAFKAGYTPTIVPFNNNTVYPECRPMQLLRLTDAGRTAIDAATIMGVDYDAAKDIYVNYRNDLVAEDGTVADSDNHYHYLIQRDHTYGQELNRKVTIKQISEQQFRAVFGPNNTEVAPEYAKNFLWTSDYYVFALDTESFKANFDATAKVEINNVRVYGPELTYTALQNTFKRRATNADGSFVEGEEEKDVTYYGAMLENKGRLGSKFLTATLKYLVDDVDYETSTETEVVPLIPSAYGFTYEYEYDQDLDNTLSKEVENGKEFAKFRVESSIEGKPAVEVLAPAADIKARHLDLVFKFRRPNISPLILQNYDIYYTIDFNRVDTTDPSNPVRTLVAGSGVYADNEVDMSNDDAVYRVRIDDVNPMSTINPEIQIEKCTFVGNSANTTYGQFASNFGPQMIQAPAPNNSKATPMSVSELWISKAPARESDGKQVADWMYIGHKDLAADDVVITDSDGRQTKITPYFFHYETYIPDTEYYNSYEYLVKHDETTHNAPDDASHPYYSDEKLGSNNFNVSYDPMRYTLIARDFPYDANGVATTPSVVISPVYLFRYAADITAEPQTDAEGRAMITLITPAEGTVSATAASDKAPARRAVTGTSAPSSATYPMPHTGDTDMSHESLLDLTSATNYIVVKGGIYETTSDKPVMTGIEDVIGDNASGAGDEQYYNLQGLPTAHPDHGIYIRVLNGKATKVKK